MTTKHNILLVDDDPGTIKLIGCALAEVGDVRIATSGKDGLRLMRELVPDLVLLDAEMPGMSGFEVLEEMKEDPILTAVPVIFVTSHSETAFEVAGLEMGAADFIAKPINTPLVAARARTQLRMKGLNDDLRRLSSIDALTGVANRRWFEESLEREWLRARRSGEPLSLLLVDIDHFKLFNDCYGKPAGDACLRSVAQALVVACLRPADSVARYDGKEFALLLPQTARAGAEHIARRILDAAEVLDIRHESSPTSSRVTVSIGVAYYDTAGVCWLPTSADVRNANTARARDFARALVKAAEAALSAAKDAGRARARSLDIVDVDTPGMTRDIAVADRGQRTSGPTEFVAAAD